MKRVVIVVEGKTEVAFVKDVLTPYFLMRNILLEPHTIITSREKNAKGGIGSFAKLINALAISISRSPETLHTTLIDYYGLPIDFYSRSSGVTAHDKKNSIEKAIADAIMSTYRNALLVPYIQLHEFEALLYSDVNIMTRVLTPKLKNKTFHFAAITSAYASPEDINDHISSAPSKRIIQQCPAYEKINDGLEIALAIGLQKIRAACPQFNAWIETLEKLA